MLKPNIFQQQRFILIAIFIVTPTVYILGLLGIFFELPLAVAAYYFLRVGTPKQRPHALLLYILILFTGWVALVFVGIPILGYMVQNSSMGR